MKDFLKKISLCYLLFIPFWGTNSSLWAQMEGDVISGAREQGEFVITSEASWFYTDTEYSFTLILPSISPNQVSIGNPFLPEGVNFLSSHKDLWVEGGNSGTSIRLLFTFSQSGSVEIPPLDVMIGGTLHQVPFTSVEVFQNPRSLKPQVSLSFQNQKGQILSLQEDGTLVTKVGEAVLVAVNVGYGLALNNFQWDLVPNAIFQQVANFQESFGTTEISHQFQPVAQFKLTPLEVGSLALPSMELEVQGYDQRNYKIFTENVPIISQVSSSTTLSSTPETEVSVQAQQAFASAFTALPEEKTQELSISHQDAQKLAQLRWQERKGFPWQDIFQKREELEKSLGIKSSKGEKSWFWGWFFFTIGFIMVGITIFGIVKKLLFLSVILGFLGILILVWGVIYTRPLSKPAGILAAETLSKIPETDATNLFPVEPYSLLEIKKEVLGWYYVSANGLEGWAPIEQVVLIGESANLKELP